MIMLLSEFEASCYGREVQENRLTAILNSGRDQNSNFNRKFQLNIYCFRITDIIIQHTLRWGMSTIHNLDEMKVLKAKKLDIEKKNVIKFNNFK